MIMEKKAACKATGFAAPTQGYEEQGIDLNRLLIHNPPATYFVRLETSEMEQQGLPKNTLLIVDRSKNPVNNHFVLIRHEGQFLCRLFIKTADGCIFSNGETEIRPIPDETEIIGVVTSSIKTYGEDF